MVERNHPAMWKTQGQGPQEHGTQTAEGAQRNGAMAAMATG
jgi:hypothetical protein